jgi:hypothetical protein
MPSGGAVRSSRRGACSRLLAISMAIVGQKTEDVYRRYAIVDEAMIREAAVTMGRGAKVRQTTA